MQLLGKAQDTLKKYREAQMSYAQIRQNIAQIQEMRKRLESSCEAQKFRSDQWMRMGETAAKDGMENVVNRTEKAMCMKYFRATPKDSGYMNLSKELGKGDMLFFPSGYPKPVRVQGAFVSDDEVGKVVDFLKEHMQQEVTYNEEVTNTMTAAAGNVSGQDNEKDSYFADAGRFVIEKEKGSIGMLQRYYKIGFNRAGRIMDQLADAGVVGPELGTKPRKILMTAEEFEEYLKKNNL